MPKKIEKLFPTLICQGSLPNASSFNQKLLNEINDYSNRDKMGGQWSKENYRGGYTSYASLNDMHHRSRVFSDFEELLAPHAKRFARANGWETKGMSLTMNSCWMNVMPRHTYHTLHLHPHSVMSGTYYVAVPKGSVSLKLEDPRMGLYMNAPVRKLYHEVTPKAGNFVLFESWLRHEVPPNQSNEPRISVSFNYSLEVEE